MRIAHQTTALVFSLSIVLHAQAATPETIYENSSSAPHFSLIKEAEKSIDIEIYEIKDTQIQQAVVDAMKRGVKVRIIQESDTVGEGCLPFEPASPKDKPECKLQKDFLAKVRAMGGTYVPYPFQVFCTDKKHCLEHGKIILVDDEKALISTGNFNATNLCDPKGADILTLPFTTCNRDYSVVSTDQNVISTLTTVFESDLKAKAYDLPKILKDTRAKKLTVSPLSLEPTLELIRSAKTTLQIENQYVTNTEMIDEIIAAAKRGVKVSLVVNSACMFGKLDPLKPNDAYSITMWKKNFTAFDEAGVRSRMFTKQVKIGGFNGYLHSKVIIVDGTRAWVGSVNGSTQALTKNREFGIFVDDLNEVNKLNQYLTADFQDPNTETWQEGLDCKRDL